MLPDADACYRAACTRNPRFDGVFFVGVTTTGIYCRPVCTARTPARARCVFFRSAAEAEGASFRACFRCRPELAPGQGQIDAVPRLVAAAVARIEAGFLNDASVDALAEELGVSARHLRRSMIAEIGVSPIALAEARRLALAKQLLHDTRLPLTEVAFASGFGSVRRFNAAFRASFARPPSALRRERAPAALGDTIALRLDYRPPLDWDALLAFLRMRAIPGVEVVEDGVYRRTVHLGDASGWIAVRRDPKREALTAEVSRSLQGVLMPIVARLRALFDLDAHPSVVASHLRRDHDLAALVEARPGLRVPGSFDAFETTVRAILGQQITVRAATTLNGRLVGKLGDDLDTPFPELTKTFPSPEVVGDATEADVARIGMPGSRARTLIAVARAFGQDGLELSRGGDPDRARERLSALPGVGAWTAEYLAMRALGWPDAFPASDIALRRALGGVTARDALGRAEAWRPFRAYAAVHLWTQLPNEIRASA